MANTLTNLVPDLYIAADIVSRELVGLIPSVSLDGSMERAAVGQQVISFQTPPSTANDLTPGVTAPNDGDQAIGNISMTITRARGVPVRWNGEESKSIGNGGQVGRRAVMRNQFAQAMRTLTNEIEADVASLYATMSRATGTPGTTPFATNLGDSAQARKILDDNGAGGDRQLVINTTSGASLRTLGQLTKANEAGTTDILRQGHLIDLHGFSVRESAKIVTPASGSAAGATTNSAGYNVGATVLTLAAAGTGAILAGDFIKFAGDPNYYGVVSGDADVSNGGTITIAAPGLLIAMSAAAKAITVSALSTRNMFFTRESLLLATRAPAIPEEGDMADDAVLITDPKSGITFEVRLYKQYRQVRYEVAVAWGWKNIKPEHTGVLFG